MLTHRYQKFRLTKQRYFYGRAFTVCWPYSYLTKLYIVFSLVQQYMIMHWTFCVFINKTSEMFKFKCSCNCMPLKSVHAEVDPQTHWLTWWSWRIYFEVSLISFRACVFHFALQCLGCVFLPKLMMWVGVLGAKMCCIRHASLTCQSSVPSIIDISFQMLYTNIVGS